MPELIVDFITSLDGFASAEGWPGWWGLHGPEYLAWLDESPERHHTLVMGAQTFRVMSGFAAQLQTDDGEATEERGSLDEIAQADKIVFSSTLEAPLALPHTRLVTDDAIEAMRGMKRRGSRSMRTIGSISLCRSFLRAGLVDRFRVVVFPVITGATGRERIYDEYPDVALEMTASRTLDGRIQVLEYVPTVLDGGPGDPTRS